jgi:hypothetical protein
MNADFYFAKRDDFDWSEVSLRIAGIGREKTLMNTDCFGNTRLGA